MFVYRLELQLKKTGKIKLNEKREIIERCVNDYTRKGKDARNRKSLKLIDVYPQILLLELDSAMDLDLPGKSIAPLSRSLLREIPELKSSIVGSGLFNATTSPSPNNVMEKNDSAAMGMTDSEMLKNLVEVILGTGPEKDVTTERIRKAAKSDIKKILIDMARYKQNRIVDSGVTEIDPAKSVLLDADAPHG